MIFNTLSITVAQRTREFATLRTLGASRRQVLRSVFLEALVIGMLASVVGLVLGLGLAKGLNALFVALGIDLPKAGTVIAARTVVVSLAVGIIVTLVASLLPALRATRVPPISAVREGSVLPPHRWARYTPSWRSCSRRSGSCSSSTGSSAHIATSRRLLALGVGVLVLFVGVALIAPKVVRPLAAVVGWPAVAVPAAPRRSWRARTRCATRSARPRRPPR